MVGYLKWRGVSAEIFNVGKFRREISVQNQTHSFFDVNNEDAKSQRENVAEAVLRSALEWLDQQNGKVAFFDATNTTNERRLKVLTICQKHPVNVNVIFIESICDDPTVRKHHLYRYYTFNVDA